MAITTLVSLLYVMVLRRMPLPRSLAKETTVGVLHNHQFLIRMLWRGFTIESHESMPNETVANLRAPNQIGEVKITLTNIEHGVSLLQELKRESSLLTSWTVTERAKRGDCEYG